MAFFSLEQCKPPSSFILMNKLVPAAMIVIHLGCCHIIFLSHCQKSACKVSLHFNAFDARQLNVNLVFFVITSVIIILEIDMVRYLLAGYFIPDVIVAAIIGAVTSLSVGPLVPLIGNWLARSSIIQFLLHISVVTLALSSQFFPYSKDAPKRVIFQHTIQTGMSII